MMCWGMPGGPESVSLEALSRLSVLRAPELERVSPLRCAPARARPHSHRRCRRVPRPRHSVDGVRPVGRDPPADAAGPPAARRRAAGSRACSCSRCCAMGLAVPALLASDSSSEVPVGFASSPTADGYWVVVAERQASRPRAQTTTYGDATRCRCNRPVVGIASTKSGKGYWLVASDGGIFSFGDARFFGSTGGIRLNQPITGIASTRLRQRLLAGRVRRWRVLLRRRAVLRLDRRHRAQFTDQQHRPRRSPATATGSPRSTAACSRSATRPSSVRRAVPRTNKWIRGVTPTNTGPRLLAGRRRRLGVRLWRREQHRAHPGAGGRRAIGQRLDRRDVAHRSAWRRRSRHRARSLPLDTDDSEADHAHHDRTHHADDGHAAAREHVHAAREHRSHRDARRHRRAAALPQHGAAPLGHQLSRRVRSTGSRARSTSRSCNDIVIHGNGAKFFADDSDRDRSEFPYPQPVRLPQHVQPPVEDMVIRGAHPNGGPGRRRVRRGASRRSTASTSSAASGSSCATSRSPTSTATSSTSAEPVTRFSAARPTSGSTTTTCAATDARVSPRRTDSTSSSSGTTSATHRRATFDLEPASETGSRSATCGSATTRSGPVA